MLLAASLLLLTIIAALSRRGVSALTSRLALRGTALVLPGGAAGAPVGLILFRAFEKGLAPVIDSLTTPQGMHAFYLTFIVVAIAVPLNTLFGVVDLAAASCAPRCPAAGSWTR